MDSTSFTENGLNVQYVRNFIEKEQADIYFTQLRTLPFYTPTFRIRGKCVKSKQQVLAYGDLNLNCIYNETHVYSEPWSRLMSELRELVEKFVDCSFNYVLLKLYTDGNSYTSQHKYDEIGLDTSFPIAVLSFGAERMIEFKKPKSPSTFIKLEHGSLYSMMSPTNELFSHGIAPDPNVKDMRISLTFRRLTMKSMSPQLKKARLQICENQLMNTTIKNVCDSSTNTYENDCSSTKTCEKDFSSTKASMDWWDQNDGLTSPLSQQKDSIYSVLKQWHLNRNTFVKLVLDYNYNLRLHIRVFKISKNDELIPTKQGIIMTPNTWNIFLGKIQKFKFHSVNDSFVCNNQLLVAYIDKEFCMLKQIYPLNSPGFFLKPTFINLFKDQIFKLLELAVEITEAIIEAILTIQLPNLILSQSTVCFSHLNFENAKQNFYNCISLEIISCIKNMIECKACLSHDQLDHLCSKPVLEIFKLNKQTVLSNLNLYKIVKKLRSVCLCHYDILFFKQINMKLLEKALM